MVPIPQCDPRANYYAHRSEIDMAVQRVLESGQYILGEEVEFFEREFADFVGAAHTVAVASGTDALEMALRACGVGVGDLVFTVSHTAVATMAAIELTGATPVLLDIDPKSYTMDCSSLQEALRDHPVGRPRAVVPVHLYGHPADMPAICEISQKHGVYVVEDCAQAHGAKIDGRSVGTWGHIAAFSFYPTKNLGALGDGGAVVSSDANLLARVRELREYGWRKRHVSEIPGFNSRLDSLQAAILRAKLHHLNSDNERRALLARRYEELLNQAQICLPIIRFNAQHVYHQFVIRTVQRDILGDYLSDYGIGSAVHYPVPVHRQPAYVGRVHTFGDLTHTDYVAGEILSLPIYPELSLAAVDRVARHIQEWENLKN